MATLRWNQDRVMLVKSRASDSSLLRSSRFKGIVEIFAKIQAIKGACRFAVR